MNQHLPSLNPKGVLPRCALSPLLFLIVSKSLSRAYGCQEGDYLNALKIDEAFYLSHLLFVDDFIIFFKGTTRDSFKPNEILDLYCNATGMEVNVNKSILSFRGVPENDIVYFSTLFPNTISNQDEGLMYLGFVLAPYDYL